MEDDLQMANTKMRKTKILQNREQKSGKNCNNGIVIGLIISILLATTGIILGVTGLVKAEQALKVLESNDFTVNELDEDVIDDYEEEEGIAEFVTITYNNGEDFISIYNGGIDYYALGVNDTVAKTVETDTESILNDIFSDNILQYLNEGRIQDDATWAIEADDIDGKTYIASGTGEAPEWFTNILNRLNLDKNGYQSKNL